MLIRVLAVLALAAAALVAPVSPASSGSEVNFKEPFEELVENQCNGDWVFVAGVQHVAITSSAHRTVMQTNWQVTEAVDLTPPFSRYEANEVDRFYVLGAGFPVTFGDEFIRELVSLDKTPNMVLRVTSEITIFDPSSGDPPVFNNEMRIQCSGKAEP